MNHALLFIGGLLVAVLSALFAVPHFVDWNGYRGVFEEEASRVLGREVRVGGAVNVRLLPTPYVRFEKVRVADAGCATRAFGTTCGTGEPFFRADAFTLRLSVPPLLRGVLEANEIDWKRPRLILSATAEGRGS
ncbi:MAG: AsmA family protein, partial [Hyphomicrobium sp.]